MIADSFRRTAGAVIAVAFLSALTACSIPDRPVWWPRPTSTLTNRQQVPAVAYPWHPGMRQLGIDVYWTANNEDSAAVIRAKARRIINYAISLRANSIAITFPFYTYGIRSNAVYTSKVTTPSPADILMFLSAAAASRIRVTVRPILNEAVLIKQNPAAWRGTIQPTDPFLWFQNYRNLLLPYALAAARGKAATFVVGTELNSIQAAPYWPRLVRAISSVYRGQLAYDENSTEFAAHASRLPLRRIGVDAWPHVPLPDSATIGQLALAWERWLGTNPARVLRGAVISEVGIAAVAGAYDHPGSWRKTVHSPIVARVQANWFAAVCRAFASEHVGGIYWWEVDFDADPAHPKAFLSDRLTFLDRPAQRRVSACFASLSSSER